MEKPENENANGELDALFMESTRSEVPPELDRRMDGRLAALREQLAGHEAQIRNQKENWIMTLFRRLNSSRAKWAVACGVAAIAVALTIGLGPWSNGRNLYAEAVAQFRKARSVTFTVHGHLGAMKFAWKEPGRVRVDFPEIVDMTMIVNLDADKGMMLRNRAKTYERMDDKMLHADPAARDLVGHLRSLPVEAKEVFGEREIDGRKVKGFYIGDYKAASLKEAVLWVDVKTADPVRIEGTGIDPNTKKDYVASMTDFDFDPDLPDSLFSTEPPEGYTHLPLLEMSRAPKPEGSSEK